MDKQQTDKKVQKVDFSIRTTFRKWLELQKTENAVLLFGAIGSGKTTICHILKRAIDKINDPNLKFVTKKKDMQVEYEGEINQKTTKSLTIYPKLTRIQKDNLNIIEVPSRIYPTATQAKKRPILDKLIHLIGLLYAVQNGKFIFLIDAKNTAAKIQLWAKTFKFIFDNIKYSALDDKLYKSIGFLVTKGDQHSQKQVYISRIDLLVDHLGKQKQLQYINLVNTVKNQSSLCTFKKINNEEQTMQQAETIYQFFKNLPETNIFQTSNGSKNEIINSDIFQLMPEEKNCLNQFNDCLKPIMIFFSNFLKQYIEHNDKTSKDNEENQSDFISDFLQSEVSAKIQSGNEKQSFTWSNVVLKRYQQLLRLSQKKTQFYLSTLGKSQLLYSYKQKVQQISIERNPILKHFLQLLSESGLILQRQELKIIYLGLIEYSIFQQRFSFKIKQINYAQILQEVKINDIFRKTNRNIYRKQLRAYLKNLMVTGKQSKQKINLIKNLLKNFLTNIKEEQQQQTPQQKIDRDQFKKIQSPLIDLIESTLMLNSIDESQPYKYLPKLYDFLNKWINKQIKLEETKNNQQLSKRLAVITASMLKNCERHDLCHQIFVQCGMYHSAFKSFNKFLFEQNNLNQSQIKNYFINYLDLLGKMNLWQQSIKASYEFAQKYTQFRPQILDRLKQISKPKAWALNQQFERNFLYQTPKLIQFYISPQLLSKIKIFIDEIKHATQPKQNI